MPVTVVVGDLNLDIVLPPMARAPRPGEELFLERIVLKAGGSAANTAITLARAGFPAKLVSRVGADGAAAFIVEELRESGVDVSTVRMDARAETGVTVSVPLPPAGERAYLTCPGSLHETGVAELSGGTLQIEDFGKGGWAVPGGHLHCASFFIQERLRADIGPILREAKRAGMTTSLDPGRRVARIPEKDLGERPNGPWDISPLARYFEFLDWFMPNGEELEGITGIADPLRALESLSPSLRGAVVKLGPEGALTRRDGRIRRHPAAAAPCIDTTCAGDCFDAGFLCGIAMGLEPDRCADLGNRFGALAVARLGLPGKDDLRSLLREFMREARDTRGKDTRNG